MLRFAVRPPHSMLRPSLELSSCLAMRSTFLCAVSSSRQIVLTSPDCARGSASRVLLAPLAECNVSALLLFITESSISRESLKRSGRC